MGIKSVIIILIVLAVFLVILFLEFSIELKNNFYNCYIDMRYRNLADNFTCKGKNDSVCVKCPYYKKYLKEVNDVKKGDK